MKVDLDKDVAVDLISYKLRHIQEQITKILNRWNEVDASIFFKKAKDGTYSEAENDVIDLKHLLFEEKRLKKLFNSL